jgi:hypothetical protein
MDKARIDEFAEGADSFVAPHILAEREEEEEMNESMFIGSVPRSRKNYSVGGM